MAGIGGLLRPVTRFQRRRSLSLHTYGRHVNYTTRSQYDLETGEKKDFVVRVE